MKIKAKLQIASAIAIASALVIAMVLIVSSWVLDKATEKVSRADAIVQNIYKLNSLTHEYLLHKTERSQIQWRSKYDSITELLMQEQVFKTPHERTVLQDIRQDHRAIEDVFSRLIAIRNHRNKADAASMAFIPELEERLAAQILVRAEAMIIAASKLSESSLEHSISVRHQAAMLALILIVILAVIMVGSFFMFYRSIGPALTKLHEGTEIIARGDLNHRIQVQGKDEIAQVASSFNGMTTKLQESYTKLENRVQERTAELRAALKEREP